jgi:hypothetical protein
VTEEAVMNEKMNDRAEAEARHDVAMHPDRRPAQDEMILMYVAGEAYAESHDRPSRNKTTEEAGGERSAGDRGAAG